MTPDVALIGCGAIVGAIMASRAVGARERIGGMVVRRRPDADFHVPIVGHIDELDRGITLVIEAAGGPAVREHGTAVLESGRDFAVVSTAALADERVLRPMLDAARAHGRRIYALSGAVGALDALRAFRSAGLSYVRYVGRKPSRAWSGTPAAARIDLDRIAGPTTIFYGWAREAVALFPQNANVAATIALAGLGFDRTRVALVADPTLERNVHRIEAESAAGTLAFEVQASSAPSNPKTSLLAAFSVVSFLQTGSGALRIDSP